MTTALLTPWMQTPGYDTTTEGADVIVLDLFFELGDRVAIGAEPYADPAGFCNRLVLFFG